LLYHGGARQQINYLCKLPDKKDAAWKIGELLVPAILLAAAKPAAAGGLFRWVRQLGGLGFIVLGLLDNSVVPLPGSMDVLTIVLASDQKRWWPYYAFMATIGSMVGGYVTYQLARGEGKGILGRKLNRSKMEKVRGTFEKWGFGAIAVPAMLPPPVPMVPFLIAAGAAQYPLKKFLGALFLGRAVRYSILAFVASLYGKEALALLAQHAHIVAWTAAALTLAGVVFALLRWKIRSKHERLTNESGAQRLKRSRSAVRAAQ
jgi:membrane protein YqaA with SNARE-associated domain